MAGKNSCYFETSFFSEPAPTIITSKINETAVSLTVALIGGNFENGTLTFTPSDISDVTFVKSDMPLIVAGLITNTDYNLTFLFSVGANSDMCGDGGSMLSDAVIRKYEPGNGVQNSAEHYFFRVKICCRKNGSILFCPPPPMFFTTPVTNYMLLYSTLLCKKN